MNTENAESTAPVQRLVMPYVEQRRAGAMVCTCCGNYSSSQQCWTCVKVAESQCKDRATIGFLVGCLEGLQWRVDTDVRQTIHDALKRAREHYSA